MEKGRILYDISQEVFSCNVYPGDPVPEMIPKMRTSEGAVCNLTAFSMCAHNGTHVDAPFHFLQDGKTIDRTKGVLLNEGWGTASWPGMKETYPGRTQRRSCGRRKRPGRQGGS